MRSLNFTAAFLFTVLFFFGSMQGKAQVGLSVSPPRVFYSLEPGETGSEKVLISNVSSEHPLHLSLTFGDWAYDLYGNNLMYAPDTLSNSCANWLTVPEGFYLSLEPGESREIDLTMTVPMEDRPLENVQTAMMFVTQMNPIDGVDAQGAAIQINVRQGIKIYRKGNAPESIAIAIQNLVFEEDAHSLSLTFKNEGNLWINGNVTTVLFNQTTGKEVRLEPSDFYTMPGDERVMPIPLGEGLDKGTYMATVMIDYGDVTTIEAAELEFSYE